MATYTDNYNLTKPTFAESADIRTINGNMDTIDDVLHASQVSLADAYDDTRTSSNPYNTGDIVMYELLMYKCLEDGVYGVWDATKWERTTAGANGGGSDVTVTPSYNSGTKIAEIDVDGTTSNIYVPAMTGASSGSEGASGLVPAPQDGDEDKYLKGDGSWATVSGGTEYVELTQAQYDALTPAEKNNGKLYFITDGNADTASGGEPTSEIIPITAGDDTTSRTFTFDKIPKKISMQWTSSGWTFYRDIIWGMDRSYYQASQAVVSDSQTYIGVSGLVCNDATKSITITGVNSYQAANSADTVGYMFVDYGGGSGGSSGGGDNDDLSEKTWTLITSTTGTSAEIDIPSGTEWFVLTAEMGGRVSEVGKERISNINKLMDVAQLTIWGKGYEWADTLGNHTTISMAVNGGKVSIKSGYNTVTAKVYAVS